MNKKIKIILFITLSLILLIKCNIAKTTGEKYFKIEDVYYQSWIKNENEQGTTVTLILSNVRNNVHFDSIVFRGQQLPVSTENKENTVIVKGTIYIGIPKIIIKTKPVNKPDQLIFRVEGAMHVYILKKIRREKMKYY